MAHSISTVSLHSSTVSIKPLKMPTTLYYFIDFSIKFITLFQTFFELCYRSDVMLVTSNAVEIFAGLYLPNSLRFSQTRCVLVHLTMLQGRIMNHNSGS